MGGWGERVKCVDAKFESQSKVVPSVLILPQNGDPQQCTLLTPPSTSAPLPACTTHVPLAGASSRPLQAVHLVGLLSHCKQLVLAHCGGGWVEVEWGGGPELEVEHSMRRWSVSSHRHSCDRPPALHSAVIGMSIRFPPPTP